MPIVKKGIPISDALRNCTVLHYEQLALLAEILILLYRHAATCFPGQRLFRCLLR